MKNDVILIDAKRYRDGTMRSTADGRAALELPPESVFNFAGNRYLEALSVIVGLQDELAEKARAAKKAKSKAKRA